MWAYVARTPTGTSLHFGRLTLRDVIKILTLGSQLRRHARSNVEILREIRAIIDAETPYEDTPPSSCRRAADPRLNAERAQRVLLKMTTGAGTIRRRFSCVDSRRPLTATTAAAAAALFFFSIFFLTFFSRNRSSRARSSSVWRM